MIRLKEEDEENIALANFIESLKKQIDDKEFSKKQPDDCLMIAVSYLWKVKLRRYLLK